MICFDGWSNIIIITSPLFLSLMYKEKVLKLSEMLDCCLLKILSYLYPFLVHPFYVHGRYLQKHQRYNFALPKIVFEVSITI